MASPDIADLSSLVPPGALPVIVVRRVSGEVPPVFADAALVRREVFTGEQRVPPNRERDEWDTQSLHVVAYVHVPATRRYHALHPPASCEPQKKDNNNKSENKKDETEKKHHLRLSSLSPEEQAAAAAEEGEEGKAPQHRRENQNKKESVLVPVGAVRLRLVDRTKALGRFPHPVAKIERLCVRRDFRQYKVGALLMAESEKIARTEMRVPAVALHAQTKAAGFYTKRGYEIETGLFHENGIEHVGMTKRLIPGGRDHQEQRKKEADGAEGRGERRMSGGSGGRVTLQSKM